MDRLAATLIPRRVHRIWIGPHRMPADYVAHATQWEALGYAVHDWSLLELRKLPISEATAAVLADIEAAGTNAGGGIEQVGKWVQMADVYGYELVRCVGGIYANTDIEPLRPLPIGGLDGFVVGEDDHHLSNALMGADADHPFFVDLCDSLPDRFWSMRWEPMNQTTGPHHLTGRWEALGRPVPCLEPRPFFPVRFTEERQTVIRPTEGFYVDHRWGHKHPELLDL